MAVTGFNHRFPWCTGPVRFLGFRPARRRGKESAANGRHFIRPMLLCSLAGLSWQTLLASLVCPPHSGLDMVTRLHAVHCRSLSSKSTVESSKPGCLKFSNPALQDWWATWALPIPAERRQQYLPARSCRVQKHHFLKRCSNLLGLVPTRTTGSHFFAV